MSTPRFAPLARIAATLALGAVATACGGPLVGPDFLGTPALVLRGDVERPELVAAGAGSGGADGGADAAAAASLARLSLFWIGFDSRTRERRVVEQHTTLDTGLASFELAVFDAPPEDARAFFDESGGVGLALIVLYADRNGNGQLNDAGYAVDDGPDLVLGASERHLVAYVARALEPGSAADRLLGALPSGFHLLATDRASDCRFVDATGCAAQGGLQAVAAATERVTLRLYPDADAVRVPSPALPGSGSSSNGGGGNLYGNAGVDGP